MSPSRTVKWHFFAGCAPGLENLLFSELKQLHVGNAAMEEGGVAFTGASETMMRVNLQSRIADRILLRLATFHVRQLSELEKKAATLPFPQFLHADSSVFVNAICKKSGIYHSGAAAARVANAVTKNLSLTSAPSCQQAVPTENIHTQSLQVRIIRDMATISIDTSGTHLHKRGYRMHVTAAPMRENIAAAALQFCRYSGEIPLINPMCGSGTLAIEGALMASRLAPGLRRHFAFESWPVIDQSIWKAEKQRTQSFSKSNSSIICASDKSEKAIAAAVHNAQCAGAQNRISFKTEEISQLSLPAQSGIIVVNPPWGKRLDASQPESGRPTRTLFELYRQIGQLKIQHSKWRLCLITSDAKLARATGVSFSDVSAPIPMGGVRINFYLG
ncbi:MAG: hypothetical protein JXR76_26325 [Deltaproteobacteria bacterium]|nr:hypothetical protein [Deltaproteobacteria bacterium]